MTSLLKCPSRLCNVLLIKFFGGFVVSRTIALSLGCLLAVSLSVSAVDPIHRKINDKVRMFIETVPTKIARKVEKEMGDATLDRAVHLGRRHRDPFLITGRNKKTRFTVKVNVHGEILEKSTSSRTPGTPIRATKLPLEVRKTLRRECHGGDVQTAYRLQESTGVVYELFVEERQQIVELQISPVGKVITKEVIEIEMHHTDKFEWHPPSRR
jgi:hypothetical protein